jgi:hypothetical protein
MKWQVTYTAQTHWTREQFQPQMGQSGTSKDFFTLLRMARDLKLSCLLLEFSIIDLSNKPQATKPQIKD